jgi:two-component system response regulator YesN
MLGVLIVDDEAIVRMNLKSMIDWEKEGFYILGEAENGKSGLELILREKPDIVITDVKMPVMDGLEMIREAGREYDGVRYVVLSSYEEFGLLKTAMNYGVTDYLLKLELTQTVLKKTLEKQRILLLREKGSLPGREMSWTEKAARFLRRILAGYEASVELENLLTQASPGIDPRRLSCIAIRFSSLNKGNSLEDEDYRTIETAVQSIINDITKPYFRGISFLADAGFCLFVYSPRTHGAEAREMCGIVIQMLRQYLNLAAAAGISSMEGSWDQLNRIMIDAIRTTGETFFRGYGIIVYSTELAEETSETPAATVYDWMELLRQALELRQAEKLKKIFRKLHDMLTPAGARNICPPSRVSRAEAFNLCFSVLGITLSVLKKEPGEPGTLVRALFEENFYETIGAIETLGGLREWLGSFEAKILNFFASVTEKSYEDHIVIAAKRYIADNFRRPISLNSAAKDLAISAGYLSSVFKRRTSTGFVEYVTGLRIDEAKNLLLSGQYKIYEVSDLVGYEDNGYFIKTFHKITGMTPKEFIRKHL